MYNYYLKSTNSFFDKLQEVHNTHYQLEISWSQFTYFVIIQGWQVELRIMIILIIQGIGELQDKSLNLEFFLTKMALNGPNFHFLKMESIVTCSKSIRINKFFGIINNFYQERAKNGLEWSHFTFFIMAWNDHISHFFNMIYNF